jgi:hypothetical protein
MKLNEHQKLKEHGNFNIKNESIESDLGENIKLENLKIIKKLNRGTISFFDCKFFNKIEISFDNYKNKDSSYVETLHFKNCIFKEDVLLENKSINFEFIFNNCVFLNNMNLKGTVFENYCDFSRSKFLGKIDLEFTTFDEKTSFKDIVINRNNQFDLRETYINNKLEFLGICSKEINGIKTEGNDFSQIIEEINGIKQEESLIVANRETARIIKDSFEHQNNIIEANKFYALEMKER